MADEAPTREPANGSETKPLLPKSCTNFGLNLIALALLLIATYEVRKNPFGLQDEVLVLFMAWAVPIVIFDIVFLKAHRNATTGLDWDKPWSPSAPRILTKLLGLALTVGLLSLGYWAFHEYHGDFYDPLWALLRRFRIPLLVSAPIYITLVDGMMREPHDSYWQLGRVVLGKFHDAKRGVMKQHFLGWLVKGFFFPLMLVWSHGQVREVVNFHIPEITWQNWVDLKLYDFLYPFSFYLDLVTITPAYVISLRVTDTHLRSAEPTMLGWAVALFCYQPFFSLFDRAYVAYEGPVSFGGWLKPFPTLRAIWAAVIIICLLIYALASVGFGVRFSNLTHRGILTNGMYRFSKHPAYLSKNLSWWLASTPFVMGGGSFWEAVRRCLLLGCVNFMYFMRARTEERHLSRDPTYVKYALWMNEHGALSFLGRWIPAFRYKPPAEPQTPPAELKAAAQ
jgi:protein-S-isoprenylcysteine O-methyltransferase Ste14